MNEHKERYYPFMDYLAEQGFITVIHDNRGHGKSIVEPDDLGYMFRKGGEGFVSDIAQLNARIRAAYPNVPVFMAASGLGAAGAALGALAPVGAVAGLGLMIYNLINAEKEKKNQKAMSMSQQAAAKTEGDAEQTSGFRGEIHFSDYGSGLYE